jgi:Ran GTPase-activating protein (RanGAP) involved in mRNA processing and transport
MKRTRTATTVSTASTSNILRLHRAWTQFLLNAENAVCLTDWLTNRELGRLASCSRAFRVFEGNVQIVRAWTPIVFDAMVRNKVPRFKGMCLTGLDAQTTTALTHDIRHMHDLRNVQYRIPLLQPLPCIRALAIVGKSNVAMGDRGIVALAACFQYMPYLEELDLADNGITDEGIEVMGNMLQHIPHLRVLNLEGNDIGEELNGYLHYIPRLEDLNLAHNNIQFMDLEKLRNLRAVDMSYNPQYALDTSGIRGLGGLRELALAGCFLGVAGTKALVGVLRETPCMERLQLSLNEMGDEGAMALSQAFPHVGKLRRLHLSCNGITSDGMTAICNALVHLPMLRHLSLSHNGFGDEGAIAFSNSMHSLPQLRRLNMEDCDIADSGICAIAANLQFTQHLHGMILKDNDITDTGAIALANGMAGMQVKDLSFRRNAIGPAGTKALRHVLFRKDIEEMIELRDSILLLAGNITSFITGGRHSVYDIKAAIKELGRQITEG